MRQTAIDTLNRQLRSGIADDKLAELVVELRAEGRLCIIHEEEQATRTPDYLLAGTSIFPRGELAHGNRLQSNA